MKILPISNLNSLDGASSISRVTPRQRRTGKSMSRRSGQTGYVWQKGSNKNSKWDQSKPAYGQVLIDVPGKEKREKRSFGLGICRTRSEAERKLKEIIEQQGINKSAELESLLDSTTFKKQAAWWIAELQAGRIVSRKKRRPVKPATLNAYKSVVEWLNPRIGDLALAEIKNVTVRELIEKMKAAKLGDKTICNYFGIVQLVVSSAKNRDGEQLHPRVWDFQFIGLPMVNKNRQRRPTVTSKDVEVLLAEASERHRVLFCLLAGSGLRIGEALGLKIGEHISQDGSTIFVRQSLWKSKEQDPKTENAVRDIDIDASLAVMLVNFIGDRKDGFLFQTKDGKPLSQRNTLRDGLHAILTRLERPLMGFHCFRRFRESVLQRSEARNLLINYWMGHADTEIGSRYAQQLLLDVEWRKEWEKKVGLGFQIPASQIPDSSQPSQPKQEVKQRRIAA